MVEIRRWARRNWATLLAAGLVLRLLLASTAYGFQYDMDTFGRWAQTLVQHPFSLFYERADSPDHLPGDLYLHFCLASLFDALGGENFLGGGYRYLLKAVPAVADILLAVMIWSIARRWVSEEDAREAALLYALNPATIFLSAIWGQWDVISGLIMLAGLAIAWTWPNRWLWAIPLLAWAVMIKPPLALLCLIGIGALVLADLRRGRPVAHIVRSRMTSVGAALVIGLGTITLLILPFDTGLPGMGMRWSLLERVNVAVELYPFTTLGAANIWMLPLGSPDRVSDRDGTFLGVTAQSWGSLVFVLALCYIVVTIGMRWRRLKPLPLVTWAMVAANYAYFLLPTRSHERYLYPAVMLLILLAALCWMDGRVVQLSVSVSMVYFLNLVGVYWNPPGILAPILFVTASVANIALFALVAAFPYWWDRQEEGDFVLEGETMRLLADGGEIAHPTS